MTVSSLPGVFHKRKLLSDVRYQEPALVAIPFLPHHVAPKGLVTHLVEHHTGDVSGFDPHSSPKIFFSRLVCIQVLQLL